MSEYPNDLHSALPQPPSSASSLKHRISTSNTLVDLSETPLDATTDARRIVRLVQCSKCSYLLKEPMTLPCGNSICRSCIPDLHTRPNISYPATASRLQGFTCPFADCRQEHAVGDCSLDVTLSKIMDLVKADIDGFRPNVNNTPLLLEEVDKWAVAGVASLREKHASRVFHGGRLVATYSMAEMGELDYDSDLVYTAVSEAQDDYRYLDVAVLEHLKESSRTELDCQVCYALFLDPLTTSCGHTFCRKCLRRALDHSVCCPICRRDLTIAPTVTETQYPSNKRVSNLLSGLCPDAVAARAEAVRQEDAHQNAELDTPLFICTMSFPSMPTFLHIFEPRYRLMIRRAIESGDRKFGMLLHNPRLIPQDNLGSVHFYQYGTLLHIVNMQLLPDGRSLIETVGVSRFRVAKHGILDAYQVGQIERIDDISLSDEEALEASETANSPTSNSTSASENVVSLPHHQPSQSQSEHVRRAQQSLNELGTMPTRALMQACLDFVHKMKEQSAPWMHDRVIQSYGECPVDPAIFPWWFASILPIAEVEKYKLLGTTSVRERLKICLGWVIRIEAQRWSQPSSCAVV